MPMHPPSTPRPVPAVITPSPLPAHWQHGVFMEIFVRAWRDSDGDGIGDLRGLTQSLDHLQDLGIRGIWLMPITKNADGDHGYATTDFRDVAPEYGTLADFDELIAQAHRRGIGVVMDYVINHAAATHPMFQSAIGGPGQPFHDWFVWSDTAPPGWEIWGKYPWYHTASKPWLYRGDLKQLPPPRPTRGASTSAPSGRTCPTSTSANPAVVAYHHDSLRFWLNRGLDGYRLDAVPHLLETNAVDWNDQPQSRVLTKQLQDLIKSYPQRYVVCEATAKPQDYGDPSVCGGAFAFGQVHHYVRPRWACRNRCRRWPTFYRQASPTMATFVSNHDIFAGRRCGTRWVVMWRATSWPPPATCCSPAHPLSTTARKSARPAWARCRVICPCARPMSWTPDARHRWFHHGHTLSRRGAQRGLRTTCRCSGRTAGSILHFYKAMIGCATRCLPSRGAATRPLCARPGRGLAAPAGG
jgi:alpha-amylase